MRSMEARLSSLYVAERFQSLDLFRREIDGGSLAALALGEFIESGVERALASGKIESLQAGAMGMGTSEVGDLIAGYAGE